MKSLLPNTRLIFQYGLTEAPRAAFLDLQADDAHLESVGKPSPLCQIRICNPDGEEADAGEEGEICVRGPMVSAGYLHKDAAPYFFGEWFRTGDLGRLTVDGYLVLTGRINEMINVGGEKVVPTDVEAAARTLPHVTDACCIAAKDDILGQSVALFLTSDTPSPYSLQNVRSMLRGRLQNHQLPAYLQYIDCLPRTVTGKLQRFALRDLLPWSIRPS